MSIIERERVQETVAPVTTKEVLHRAADLLEEFGWSKDDGEIQFSKPGPFCLATAAQEALRDFGVERDVFSSDDVLYGLYRALGFAPAATPNDDVSPWSVVPKWNDKPGRTKAEVVARLRAAAEAA